MVQNRNKLIDIFIGNVSNVVVHRILERAVFDKEELFDRYRKEMINSFEIAKRYREKINPVSKPLSERDMFYVRERVIRKAISELSLRISKGYVNIDLDNVKMEDDIVLKEMRII